MSLHGGGDSRLPAPGGLCWDDVDGAPEEGINQEETCDSRNEEENNPYLELLMETWFEPYHDGLLCKPG